MCSEIGLPVVDPDMLNAGVSVHGLLPRLPSPAVLLQRARAFAVLDAIFEPRFRRHWFVQAWKGNGTSLASMDNGSGDNYTIIFDPDGTLLLGFDHESAATPWREDERIHWPGLLDGVPASLQPYLEEPAFQFDGFLDITVCAWHEVEGGWRCGPVDFSDVLEYDEQDPDGAEHLFALLADGTADAYTAFVEQYFGVTTDVAAVGSVLSGRALTQQLAIAVNPEVDFVSLAADIAFMGYPVIGAA